MFRLLLLLLFFSLLPPDSMSKLIHNRCTLSLLWKRRPYTCMQTNNCNSVFLCLNSFVCSSRLFTEVDLDIGAGYLQSHGCTLALTNSHDTVSQMINWRKTKWDETKDFKSSMIFSVRLHMMCVFFVAVVLLCVFLWGGEGSDTIFKEQLQFNPYVFR